MARLKVVTVVGTRPEIIRLSRVIDKLNQSDSIDHVLVHTGQNYDYELNQIFFDDLEIKAPDHFLEVAGKSSAETIGNTISEVDKILEKINPDAYLVLGDTNSCVGAIAAKKRKIPVFHMEAGNRCFDQRVPEELNRKIVDHVADINLTYSTISREYLLKEGFAPDRIIKTGSPMFEVINHYMPKAEKSSILNDLKLEKEQYFLVSCHREENIDSVPLFNGFVEVLNGLADEYKLPIIVSTHPRTRKMIEKKSPELSELVQWSKPFAFTDFLHLELNAKVVLSDSGTISEEASILNLHALNIREAHERPEGMEEAAVMMVGMNKDRVLQAINQLDFQQRAKRNFPIVEDYSKPNVSDKVVRIILSYVDYVRRTVWFQ